MPGACGMACEVCKYKNEELFENPCGGCVAGTDSKAPQRLQRLRSSGVTCEVFECAVEKKVDYCLSCEAFPCEVHERGFPYDNELLNTYKNYFKAKK